MMGPRIFVAVGYKYKVRELEHTHKHTHKHTRVQQLTLLAGAAATLRAASCCSGRTMPAAFIAASMSAAEPEKFIRSAGLLSQLLTS